MRAALAGITAALTVYFTAAFTIDVQQGFRHVAQGFNPALGASVTTSQDPRPAGPSFAVQVDAVPLDVLVTDKGRPVGGLDLADFALKDNGVMQRITSVTREDRPLDLFFVIDRSDSVTGEPLDALREAARMLLDELGAGDRASLLTFSHRVQSTVRPTTDESLVRTALDALQPSGATSLFDAVYSALMLREASAHRAMVLVFSDGRDTSSWMPSSAVVNVAKETDVVVYGITLGAGRPAPAPPLLRGREGAVMVASPPATPRTGREPENVSAFLEEIATATGGQLFRTDDPGRLRQLFLSALRDMRARYTLTYVPENVERSGWHAIEVTLTRRHGKVTARAGYFVP